MVLWCISKVDLDYEQIFSLKDKVTGMATGTDDAIFRIMLFLETALKLSWWHAIAGSV